ncbi:MAG TPA: hypothetical protein VGO73_05095 [Pyrinomonadaceae bacterium]|jgi:hypothetical protein|nr:hypothetical protein [Pyrinomonadaceae bacterium]
MFRKVSFVFVLLAIVVAVCVAPKRMVPVLAQKNIPPTEGVCCGKKPPSFPDIKANNNTAAQTYSTFSGQIAVVTGELIGGSSVAVVDLKNENAGVPVDTNWNSSSVPPTQVYSHPDWATARIGSVFGLTLDDIGNVYVTASTAYSTDSLPGGATGGEVYRIDGTSGTVSKFATLPNKGPALGNIEFSCGYQSFYVTNFADGRIYQMVTDNSTSPPTAKVLSAFSPATGAIASGFSSTNGDPEFGRDYSQFIPKNNPGTKNWGRPWAVKVQGNRLYYSLWRQDFAQHTLVNAPANEVWSVQLTTGGAFVPNSQQLEITLPTLQSTDPLGGAQVYSNPVSSIAFNQAGDMLLAERSMNGDQNNPFAAHKSRVLEYTLAVWTLQNPTKFGLGTLTFNGQPSSAGGAVYDSFGSRVWGTSDAMHLNVNDQLYGIQGLPQSGGNIHNSILVDMTDSTVNQDKNQMGDIEIPCVEEGGTQACAVKTREISCKADGTGGYLFTFTVTNNTGKPVTSVLLTPPLNSNFSITPQDPPLPGGVLPNGQSITLQVTINGGHAGQKVCFTVTLMTKDGPCCTVEVCPVLPDCCAAGSNVSVKCNPNGSYSYVLSVVNTSPNTIQHIYLHPPAGVTMTPSYFAVSIAPGATFQTPPITITGAHPGSFCFGLSLHTEGMKDCCSGEQCIILPACSAYGPR